MGARAPMPEERLVGPGTMELMASSKKTSWGWMSCSYVAGDVSASFRGEAATHPGSQEWMAAVAEVPHQIVVLDLGKVGDRRRLVLVREACLLRALGGGAEQIRIHTQEIAERALRRRQ